MVKTRVKLFGEIDEARTEDCYNFGCKYLLRFVLVLLVFCV